MAENKHISEKIVTFEDTAAKHGSGFLEVFATPAMIALMENAAATLAGQLIDPEMSTVGIEINIKHLRATPIGVKVSAEAQFVRQDGRALVFNVTAFDDLGEIGRGTHTRFIISPKEFMSKISR